MTTTVYGIKNCNSMKKAFDWLDEHGVSYEFHDYKKNAPDTDVLKQAISEHGWEKVINRAGMTWRKLDDATKNSVNENNAVDLALEKSSVIKRPLIVHDGKTYLGFNDDKYKEIFA